MKKYLITIGLLLALIPSVSFGAIAFDSAATAVVNPGVTIGISLTVASTSTLLLAGCFQNSGDIITPMPTWNGVSMNLAVKNANIGAGDGSFNYIFYLSNPDTGTHNFQATSSASSAWACTISSYGGTATTNVIDATSSAGSASSPLTTSATTTVDNDWGFLVVRNAGAGSGGLSASTNSVLRGSTGFAGTYGAFDTNSSKTPPGLDSMVVTAGGGNLSGTMVVFKPTQVTPPTTPTCRFRGHGICH